MYGLIGYPLSHSFSQKYFEEKFLREGVQEKYAIFPLEKIEDLTILFQQYADLKGLNVTIPYKKSIIPFLDKLQEDAQKIGAVNCIQFLNGQKIGYNTDWLAFKTTLVPLLKPWHTHALILGSGGAAQAVKYALDNLEIKNLIVSRKPQLSQIAYEKIDTELLKQNLLIVNTTPLGMYPNIEAMPMFPTQLLSKKHLVYDLIYNPENTLLMQEASKKGAIVKNGYDMLVTQAELGWKIWNSY